MTTALRLALPLEHFHQSQGPSNDCGPYTAAIVINALTGAAVDGARLAEEMDKPRWPGWPLPLPVIRRIPRWATFPWGMVDVFQQYGLKARWRIAAGEHDLVLALRQGRIAMPTIGTWRPLSAHIKPLAAYHPELGWGFVDPAGPPGLSWQSPQSFRREWRPWLGLLVETLASR